MEEFGTEGSYFEVQVLAHMYGRDFEIYESTDGINPSEVIVSYNKLTSDEPIRMWLKGTDMSFYLIQPLISDSVTNMQLLSNTTYHDINLKFHMAVALRRIDEIKDRCRLAMLTHRSEEHNTID